MRLRLRTVHGALLPIVVFAAVAGSGAVLALRDPVYEARAQVVITPLSTGDAPVGMPVFRDLGDPIRTIETAAALLDDRRAAELTAARLGRPWTARSVAAAVEVTPHGQTNIVDVTARAATEGGATAVANGFMTAALDLRSQALSAASGAALANARRQVDGSPAGSAAREAAQARYTTLDLLRTFGDPSVTEAQDATSPATQVGTPDVVVLGLAAAAGLLAAGSLALALGSERGLAHAAGSGARPHLEAPVSHYSGRRASVDAVRRRGTESA